ncbi:MAG: hypothetical protein WKF75_02935 [Singulisphaera sp.]
MDHPNLVRIYDLYVDAERRPFLVMQYLRVNLQQHAEQHLDSRAAATLVAAARGRPRRAPAGPGALRHQAGEYPGRRVRSPRLIDFGMARLRDVWTDDAAGPSGGTPDYMAPEQARGGGSMHGATFRPRGRALLPPDRPRPVRRQRP